MVCMSASATSKIIEDLSDSHDIQVKLWGDELKEHIEVRYIMLFLYSTM